MKILIPTVDYPPIEGGIATVAVQVSRALAALGHEVTVVAPALRPSNPQYADTQDFDRQEPVRVIRFGGYDWGWMRLFPLLRATWPLLRESGLILAINIAYGGVIARLAKARHGTRYIAFAYAYEFLKFRRAPLIPWVFRSVYRRAETTVAISRFTRRNLEAFGVQCSEITVVLPGANEAPPVPEAAVHAWRDRLDIGDERIVLAVGRFIPRKGHLMLVAAMPDILEACPHTHLVLAGRGPLRDACLKKAKALGIEGYVHCPGYVGDEDLAALYQTCAVFALPTGRDENGQVEGFGLVFTEAHAHGKPVVAGRSGGVEDAVIDGQTGLLVQPEDAVALANAIVRLFEDPDLARRLGAAGRKRVETELNWTLFTRNIMDAVGEPPS